MMLTIPTATSSTASALQVHGDVLASVILQYLNLLILCAGHNLTVSFSRQHDILILVGGGVNNVVFVVYHALP
jgi:hypothetical protein